MRNISYVRIMAEHIAPSDFINALLPVVGQCARASLIFYGQVADISKAADKSLIGSNIPVGRFYASYPSDCTYELNSSKETGRQPEHFKIALTS